MTPPNPEPGASAGIGPAPLAFRAIDAAATRELRQRLLRPDAPPDRLVYPGDDAPETLHAGAFADQRLVGIASVYRQPPPGQDDPGAWRLRGMATLPEVRRRGVGTALLHHCMNHAAARGGRWLWCDARVPALDFYRAEGFDARGEVYHVPGAGPHRFMWRALQPGT